MRRKWRKSAILGGFGPLFLGHADLHTATRETAEIRHFTQRSGRPVAQHLRMEMSMTDTNLPDLLTGLAAIAAHLGWTERQALHQHEKGLIPTFKQGRIVCARRSTLAKHFAEQEKAATSARG